MLDHKYKVFYHLAQTPNTTKVAKSYYYPSQQFLKI